MGRGDSRCGGGGICIVVHVRVGGRESNYAVEETSTRKSR